MTVGIILFSFISLSKINFITNEMTGIIIGGHNAKKIAQFSYTAQLSMFASKEYKGPNHYFSCCASILNQDIILTAAHCLLPVDKRHIQVFVGVLDNMDITQSMFYESKDGLIHENYIEGTGTNDVALIKLRKSLKFGKNVGRVALTRTPPTHYRKAVVAGWGLTSPNDDAVRAETLKYLTQKVYSREECEQIWSPDWGGMDNGTFCAGWLHSKTNAASGDSGGALVVRGFIQIGITSSVDPNRGLTAYTDISVFYNWIKKNARKLNC